MTDRDATPRLLLRTEVGLLAAVCYLPQLLTAAGRLNADTKQYLYLDPADLLDRARSLWDAKVAGGAVTHQAIGYLWPMGPFYWLADRLAIPDWIAQRIWIGSIQLLAALGALVLFRTLLRRQEPGHVVAAVGYGLSPFVLGHVTGQSALLLPFAALGWMVWALVRGLDERTWRWPALFALLVTTCGSLNGTSIFFVLIGAVLWVPFGVWTLGRATPRDGIVLLARAGALTVATQLWWLVAYLVGGRFGLPILAITETVQATSSTTSAAEVLRGLGYWYFYGGEPGRPWLPDLAGPYVSSPFLITVSFALPVAALVLASRLRWSSRAYFALLVTVGTLISTISFSSPWRSPAGAAFEEASRRIDIVLSLRNTQRAAPLVALGVMGLLAAALTALRALHRRISGRVVLSLAVVAVLALPGQWRGLIAERFHRDAVPGYWYEAGRLLDEGEGKVLELPGIDFAAYRWGNTLDPVSLGLTDRPVYARELVPQGSPVGVSILNALDRSLQEGWAEPAAIGPLARLLGASTILVRNDLEFERYHTVRPRSVWRVLTDPAAGLGRPVGVGEPRVNQASADHPLLDEVEVAADAEPARLPPVALIEVPAGRRDALTTHATGRATVADASGEGLYSAAAAGLLDDLPGVLLLGADLALPEADPDVAGPTPRYLVTDSNRKQDELWYSLRENVGATEPAGSGVSDVEAVGGRIDLVDGMPTSALTTVRWVGAKRIWASSYGGGATLLPEDRPSNAFDGDPDTAWRVSDPKGGPVPIVGIELDDPVTTDHIDLVQPQARPGTQPVTALTVVLDGERRFPITVPSSAAFLASGLRVRLDGRPFQRLSIELDDVEGLGAAGIGEVVIPGVEVTEVVQLPSATLDRVGGDSAGAPLAVVLTRLRANPAEPLRSDPELRLVRSVELPVARELELSGTARLRANGDDVPGERLTDTTGAVVRTREHLPGDRRSRGSSAFDGDLGTAWTTPFVGLEGQWWEATLDDEVELDRLSLDLVADAHHSLPKALEVSVDGGTPQRLEVPEVERGPIGTVRHLELELPEELEGEVVRVEVVEARPRTTPDWYTDDPIALPIAFAEIGIPGADPVERGVDADSGCRDDLLTIDGEAVPIRVRGTTDEALDGGALDVATCDGDPLTLAAGEHRIETVAGHRTGLDLDRLVLRTADWVEGERPTAPTVSEVSSASGRASGTVDADGAPFWVVVDQSASAGWELSADGAGGPASVDGPHPVDGNAVGWLVTPAGGGPVEVSARWAPQRTVSLALAVSALTALGCVALVLRGRRRPVTATPYGPPRLARGTDVDWSRSLPGAAATAVIAGVCVHPLAAVPAGAAMALFSSRPRWGRFIPPALIGAAALGVLWKQVADAPEPNGVWPGQFGFAHFLTLVAVVILGMEALAEAGRHRKARLRREAREALRAAHARLPGPRGPRLRAK